MRRVLIVGGGPAGMTAAVALARRGIGSHIVEIEREWSPEGIGLLLQPPTLRALASLDLLEACAAVGYRHDVINLCDGDGAVVFPMSLRPLTRPDDPPAVGISRRALHEVLEARLREAGVEVTLGQTVTRIEQDAGGVEVELTDGSRGRWDLVVGADGINSKVRKLVFGGRGLTPRYAGQIIWRVGLERPHDVSEYLLMQRPGDKVGVVPIARDELYVYCLQTRADVSRPPREELPERFRAALAPYGGVVPRLAAQIVDPAQVDYRGLYALLVPPPWHEGRVLLIGDAAHATTPHVAMGVGIAIEDAVVLAEHLAEERPLAAFAERRYERCRLVVESSWQLSVWEQDPAAATEDDRARLSAETAAALAAPI